MIKEVINVTEDNKIFEIPDEFLNKKIEITITLLEEKKDDLIKNIISKTSGILNIDIQNWERGGDKGT